jgi:SOS response regulatory protein OraA/RecX
LANFPTRKGKIIKTTHKVVAFPSAFKKVWRKMMTDEEHPEFDRLTVDEAIRVLEARIHSRLELSKYVAWSLTDITALEVVLTELKKLRK